MVTNLTGLTDDNPGTVVDKKMVANLSARMDVNAGFFVRPLTHHPWNKGNTNPIKFMIKSMSAEAAALIDRGASVWVMPKVGPV